MLGAGTDHVVNLEIAVNDPRLERPSSRLDFAPGLPIRCRTGQIASVPGEQEVDVRDRTDGFFRLRVDDGGLRSRELGERTVAPGESVPCLNPTGTGWRRETHRICRG